MEPLAYRNDRYAPAVNDYKPGTVVEMEIESLPIVWTVSAGNRIRIDISPDNPGTSAQDRKKERRKTHLLGIYLL